jgi:hypothetical protein
MGATGMRNISDIPSAKPNLDENFDVALQHKYQDAIVCASDDEKRKNVSSLMY